MIRPPGRPGVAFSERSDGDMRFDLVARAQVAAAIGISEGWATVTQVHGSHTVRVVEAGGAGEADAIWTSTPGLPVTIFTADCIGVVLHASEAVGVAHAGWRGVDQGVVNRLRSVMAEGGHPPTKATVGPGIGPCCFEVGPEVSERFGDSIGQTTWGTTSVDLAAALGTQMAGIDLWAQDGCTRHQDRWYSHREDGTPERMATIGWVP